MNVINYTTNEVLDSRISVPAQHALVRMSKSSDSNADAMGLLASVKSGRIGGIFCVNWRLPAERSLRLGSTWWNVIPPNEDAWVLGDFHLADGADDPPYIVFRRELDPRPDGCGSGKLPSGAPLPVRLDAALKKMWRLLQRVDDQSVALVPHPRLMHLAVRSSNTSFSNAETDDGANSPWDRVVVDREIYADDQRELVRGVLEVPYRFACCINSTWQTSSTQSTGSGTGFLIGGRHVLTAGHVVYDRDQKLGMCSEAVVMPARNGVGLTEFNYGCSIGKKIRVFPGWINNGDPAYDLALITLPSASGAGYWGTENTSIRAMSDSSILTANVELTGYPGDKCREKEFDSLQGCPLIKCPEGGHKVFQHSTQWRSRGRIRSAGNGVFLYKFDTYAGHSGSPVWITWKGQKYVIGVHRSAGNMAVKLTGEKLKQISKWMKEDGERGLTWSQD